MALKSRDIVLGFIVTCGAWTVVAHSAPTLRYTGYAFLLGSLASLVLGSVLILWSSRGSMIDGSAVPPRPKALAFELPHTWNNEIAALEARSIYRRRPLHPPSFIISDNIDGLLDLITKDFVTSWYKSISPRSTFANEVHKSMSTALANILDRILEVDFVEVAVSKIVPVITLHLRDCYDAERAVRGKYLDRNFTESDELDLAIAAKYRNGKLHAAASLSYSDTKLLQQEHLRRVVEKILPAVLPEGQSKSRAVNMLVKEILACAVLFPIMQLLSDPDAWNQMLESYGRTMLQDRKTVRKLRAALDEHASPSSKTRQLPAFPRLAPHDSDRKFERFIRAARTCPTLSDARRFRSEISSQLKRGSRIEGQDQLYLRRLENGKRTLDQRVAYLSTSGTPRRKVPLSSTNDGENFSRLEHATLSQVLHDASGLSYFMEFMDRQRMMPLVQFWIVVDGFRNPLEDVFAEDNELPPAPQQWSDSDRMDIAQINEAYFSKTELQVSEQSRSAVNTFLAAGQNATPQEYQLARNAILRAQKTVEDEMESKFYPKFQASDLFYKYLSSDEASSATISTPVLVRRVPSLAVDAANTLKPTFASRSSLRALAMARPELRKTATVSVGVESSPSVSEDPRSATKPLEGRPSTPLFDDDYDTDPLSRSAHSVETESSSPHQELEPESHVVAAVEAALNDIMETDPDDSKDSLQDSSNPTSRLNGDEASQRSSLDLSRIEITAQDNNKFKPSIASLGLVNASSRIGVFTDDDLFPDEEKFIQDEREDPEEEQTTKVSQDEIHEAAPGDLGLVEAISALTIDIERLAAQNSVVESLTRKAELTNNTAELRILRKSKASLQREMRRKELQRQQYIVQEGDNSLYGRSSVRIKSIVAGNDVDGHEYALYVVEVQRKAGDQMAGATWAVARRYSEFHELNQRLRTKYSSVRQLEFPRRRVVMKLQRDFLQKRRIALERYLRDLLVLPDVCRSRDLRAFLSQQAIASPESTSDLQGERQDIITRLYNSVTDGMEDLLGNIPVLDQLSVAGQNLISAATSQLGTPLDSTATISEDPITNAEAEKELNAFEDRELEPFVKPICDVFLELFELNRRNNWLRGRAVVVVLHQLLGGTIERKVREGAKQFVQEENVIKYLDYFKDTMWPNSVLKRESKIRTETEKKKAKTEASLMLATLIPDMAGSVVGRANAQVAARRVAATVNNERLNTHLAFTILDQIMEVLFGKSVT